MFVILWAQYSYLLGISWTFRGAAVHKNPLQAAGLSIPELKRRIAARGIDSTGCIQREDLVGLLVAQRVRDAKNAKRQKHFAQQQQGKRPRGAWKQEQRHAKRQRRQQQ